MHRNEKYVNKNTSMPIKQIFSCVHIEQGRHVEEEAQTFFFPPFSEFGANVEMFTQIIAQGHFK